MSKLLQVTNASFAYKAGRSIFSDVSFEMSEGQVLAIIGPNGAGKSTLLNCLVGQTPLSQGEVQICGIDINKLPRREVAKLVGYVPQTDNPVYGYSVRTFVVMGRTPYISTFHMPSKEDYLKADEAIKSLGIQHLAQRSYMEISGGEQQQASLARVVVQEPKLIVLDEPTSALDFGNQMRVLRMVKQLGKRGFAVIMTTHSPDHAIMLNDTVAMLDNDGHLCVGKPDEIIESHRLSKMYREDVKTPYVDCVERHACLTHL